MIIELPESFPKDIAEIIDSAVMPLIKRIDAQKEQIVLLTARVADLEDHELSYKGIWEPDQQFRRGHIVTLNGAMFHANQKTTSRPGTDSTWQLCVKSPGR
jgi:hypothetical protein